MPKANVVSRVLAVIGFIALSATVAHAGAGSGGGGFGLEGFQCYLIDGDGQTPPRTMELNDQFGTRTADVVTGRLLCTPVTATVLAGPELDSLDPAFAFDHFKCYNVFEPGRPTPQPAVKLTDQLDIETVRVSTPVLLCVIANKNDTFAPPAP